jgi:hypothetical protein
MSWGFHYSHLIELHFDDNLLQLILNRWVKLEVHSLATRNLKSFPVLGLFPLVEFSVRSVVLRHIQNQLNELIELEMTIENGMYTYI